jgi:integrase
MPVRRDPRTGRWFFRATAKKPDGTRARLFGTPGIPGPYHDLAQSKVGALEAERRAINEAMNGKPLAVAATSATKEAPTIKEYSETFKAKYKPSGKPSSKLDKAQRLRCYILPALGDVQLDRLRQEQVDDLVAGLLRRGLARKTVNNITATLSSLVKYAVRNKVIAPVDLTFLIKAQDTAVEAVGASELCKLLDAVVDPRYRAAILLAADAGLRIGEIRALRWSDVNERCVSCRSSRATIAPES